MDAEIFSCPNCDTEIFVDNLQRADYAVCSNCGHRYLIAYDDLMENYRLQADEPPQYPTDIDTDRV